MTGRMSDAALARVRHALEAIVGADSVFLDAQDQHAYADKYAIDDSRHIPLGAVAPTSAAQVQAIVRVAAEHRLPLWPISRGKNFGYGEAAPQLAGSLVLDMSRMKRIEVDVENGTVLLEPGVGFYDLYDHLKANNIKLWLSTPGNSWGSVCGNALDRGVGYTPYGDNTAKICGLEVVLPDGSLVRTGMGAMAGSPTWQLYRYGFGPAWDQMFVQSNLGIVTKLGMWLMPQPESMLGMDLEFGCRMRTGTIPAVAISAFRRCCRNPGGWRWTSSTAPTPAYQQFGMDYQASFAFGERHLINVNAILLDKDDPELMRRVDPFMRSLIADAHAHGYGEYRTHLDYMDTVAATYDYNNHALLRLNETVKNAIDPHGIIAPGKSGIWPTAYAKERQA